MRKLPGEVQRHAEPVGDGWGVEIDGDLRGVGKGATEAEAHRAAEADYDVRRRALVGVGEATDDERTRDKVADCLRLFNRMTTAGGTLDENITPWDGLSLTAKEVWRDKATFLMGMSTGLHQRRVEPVRGQATRW